jgi:L-histidine Nalpha-methyltransferase
MVANAESRAGNMLRTESVQFLSAVKKAMTPMDRLLIGMDLKKDTKLLLAAYNDSLGVTARFNKNLLLRINEQLDSNFDLENWRHESIWNSQEGRIEMRLWSMKQQTVVISKLNNLTLEFAAGESIHTENCHKYSQEDIDSTASKSGFEVDKQWFDKDEMFSLNLFEPLFSSS